jgi:hypothetical protein
MTLDFAVPTIQLGKNAENNPNLISPAELEPNSNLRIKKGLLKQNPV